ncbi:tRNA1(Val) (adenine(37)-N6)-methyltransferase [Riemerella columbina]|uniref:tRNA1(Val) (adenine(37)-N6)-methyltransferase n=1 Tax=Riemerella columbina TaxID=103810 RepID=UPI00037E68B2|nr:methyltransferase [Riemerella columbina]
MSSLKPFHFQQFSIAQSKAVFRVGTDAVLLGALAFTNFKNPIGKTLEIGTGTGIISLMLAQRFNHFNITGIDYNPDAAHLTALNFKNAPFKDRLSANKGDIKTFKSEFLFDFIVCNPPYFEINTSTKDSIARQQIQLNFEDLILNASRLLPPTGLFSVIIPYESKTLFETLAQKHSLFLHREVLITGIEGGSIRRVILEFSKQPIVKATTEHFTIEKSPRQYSDQYIEATKAFHIFK